MAEGQTFQVSLEDALRYAGVPVPTEEMRERMAAVQTRLQGKLQPRRVWKVFELVREEGGILLAGSGVCLTGTMAETMLEDCRQAVLLACTAGAAFDAILRTWQVRDLSEAVLMDGYGSALAEAVADAAEQEISGRFPLLYRTDRFSPGYGDLPLDLQPQILQALNATRQAGITAADSLMLQPCKSITVVIGLAERPQRARIRGCGFCSLRETCGMRKGGKTCAV